MRTDRGSGHLAGAVYTHLSTPPRPPTIQHPIVQVHTRIHTHTTQLYAGTHLPPQWTEWLTDTCKNITFASRSATRLDPTGRNKTSGQSSGGRETNFPDKTWSVIDKFGQDFLYFWFFVTAIINPNMPYISSNDDVCSILIPESLSLNSVRCNCTRLLCDVATLSKRPVPLCSLQKKRM